MAEPSFRRRKAQECAQGARLALEHRLWATAVSRAYYCLYHVLLEVLTAQGESAPKRGWNHDVLRDRFWERYCKSGRHFNRQDGQTLNVARNSRMDADYRDVEFEGRRVRRLVDAVERLYQKAIEVLDG